MFDEIDKAFLPILCAIWQMEQPHKICSQLRLQCHGQVNAEAQDAVTACLQHKITQQFHPDYSYQCRLLKAVMLATEEDGQEISDSLADMQVALLLHGNPQAPHGSSVSVEEHWSYKTYMYGAGPLDHNPPTGDLAAPSCSTAPKAKKLSSCCGLITLRLSLNLFEGGTGCHEWEAGFFLAEFVLSFPDLFKGQKCLELGCGTGVVGVAICRSQATNIMLTDGNHAAVQNCECNLSLNGCKVDMQQTAIPGSAQVLQVQQMYWEEPGTFEPDIILAADVLYDPGAIPALVQLLEAKLVGENGVSPKSENITKTVLRTAYIATTKRNLETLQHFLEAVSVTQLDIQDITSLAFTCSVQFQHHVSLQHQRANIVLHKFQYNPVST